MNPADPRPTDKDLPDVVRRLEARVAMLEDAVSVYGPPKARRSMIPEWTVEQRKTLVLMACAIGLVILLTRGERVR